MLPPVTSGRTPRARSARGQGAAVRDELIVAAEALLAERGSADAVPVSEIVRRVGVTAPVLYAHFADKDALFVAVHARRMDEFRETLRRAARRGSSPLDSLERRGRAYIRYAVTRSDAYRALFMTPNSLGVNVFEDAATRELTAYDDLLDNIRACMADGSVPERDVEVAGRVAWAQIHGLATMLITMPEIADGIGVSRLVDRMVHAMSAGLAAG